MDYYPASIPDSDTILPKPTSTIRLYSTRWKSENPSRNTRAYWELKRNAFSDRNNHPPGDRLDRGHGTDGTQAYYGLGSMGGMGGMYPGMGMGMGAMGMGGMGVNGMGMYPGMGGGMGMYPGMGGMGGGMGYGGMGGYGGMNGYGVSSPGTDTAGN